MYCSSPLVNIEMAYPGQWSDSCEGGPDQSVAGDACKYNNIINSFYWWVDILKHF